MIPWGTSYPKVKDILKNRRRSFKMFSHEMIKSAISLWKSVRSAKFKELGQLVTDVYNMNSININNLTNLAVCSTKSTKDKLFFILVTRIYLSEMVRTFFCRISCKSELLLKLRRSQTKDILILVKCSGHLQRVNYYVGEKVML